VSGTSASRDDVVAAFLASMPLCKEDMLEEILGIVRCRKEGLVEGLSSRASKRA
jgi:hypothetical protein